jgi:hypothetical protein
MAASPSSPAPRRPPRRSRRSRPPHHPFASAGHAPCSFPFPAWRPGGRGQPQRRRPGEHGPLDGQWRAQPPRRWRRPSGRAGTTSLTAAAAVALLPPFTTAHERSERRAAHDWVDFASAVGEEIFACFMHDASTLREAKEGMPLAFCCFLCWTRFKVRFQQWPGKHISFYCSFANATRLSHNDGIISNKCPTVT